MSTPEDPLWLATPPKPAFLRKLFIIGAPKPSYSSRPPTKLHPSAWIRSNHRWACASRLAKLSACEIIIHDAVPESRWAVHPHSEYGAPWCWAFHARQLFLTLPLYTMNPMIPMLKRRCHHASNLRLSDRPYAPYMILDMPCKSSCPDPSGLEAFAMVVCSVM